MEIRLVAHADIDKIRYNSAVHYALNGNTFGYKWYLDAMAREWDVLVEGEYESVLPLPYRPLWLGRQALYQPALVRELGIYSVNILSEKRVNAFWAAIPEVYKLIELQVEPRSRPTTGDWTVTDSTNYYLRMDKPYPELAADFATDTAARLAIAEAADWQAAATVKPERLAQLFQQGSNTGVAATRKFHGLQRIMWEALHRGWGFAAGLEDAHGVLVAATFLIYSHGRAVNLISVEAAAAKKGEALLFLFDNLLRSHANHPLVFDFNDHPTLGAAFGASAMPTLAVKRDERLWGLL